MRTKRSCPVCSGNEAETLYKLAYAEPGKGRQTREISLVCCDCCGFVYKDVSGDIAVESAALEQENRYESFEQDFTKRYLQETAELLRKTFSSKVCLLDAGCSTGYLLYALKQAGFSDVHGLDPSRVSCQKARARGADVIQGNLYDALPGFDHRFDVIVLSQVLEHVIDLPLCLQHLKKWLKKDGYLFLSVPDEQQCSAYYGSIASILCAEHVNHFGQVGLDRLLEQNGFQTVSHHARPYHTSLTSSEDRDCIMASFDAVYKVSTNSVQTGEFVKDLSVRNSILNLLAQYEQKKFCKGETIAKLKRSGRTFVIWGVSHMAMSRLNQDLAGLSIVAFTDSDVSKQGKHINGLPVVAPETLDAKDAELIVMDNNTKDSICRSIAAFGLQKLPVHIL